MPCLLVPLQACMYLVMPAQQPSRISCFQLWWWIFFIFPITGKDHNTPVKTMTLPCLELLWTILATNLLELVRTTLPLMDAKAAFWQTPLLHRAGLTDLLWHGSLHAYMEFYNRSYNRSQRTHCPGPDNPVDLVTREHCVIGSWKMCVGWVVSSARDVAAGLRPWPNSSGRSHSRRPTLPVGLLP